MTTDILLVLCAAVILPALAQFALACIAIMVATKRGDRGWFWCRYVVGLHRLFSPVYRRMGQRRQMRGRAVGAIYNLLTLPCGVELPLEVRIGKRLHLVHSFGTILHADLTIGDDCCISAGVIVGATFDAGMTTIGDSVYLGAHATVLGPISVGNGALVGGSAVVTKDVPERSVVVGNPARVIRTDFDWPSAHETFLATIRIMYDG